MDIFPIWKSTYFFLSGDNAVVRIIAEDGVVIYRARVSRIPDEDYMHVNLNKPCQAYIDSRIVPVDTEDAVYPMDAYEEFVLQQLNESTGVWADIYTFAFKNDWSYEDTDTLSEPINGHAAAGQVVSLSYLVTGNTESVCYEVVCPEPGPTPPTPPDPPTPPVPPTPPTPDPTLNDYLTFQAVTDGTITFNENYGRTIQYTRDGVVWHTLQSGGRLTVSAGDIVKWKDTVPELKRYAGNPGIFGGTAKFNVWGNIMSILHGDSYSGRVEMENYAFASLFNSSKVVSARYLNLPSPTAWLGCYQGMFMGCRFLVEAPALPATVVGESAYICMFYDTALTTAPALPATEIYRYCYCSMFEGCESLVNPPALPATTLADNCYNGMFMRCTSLTTAPVLPATTLVSSCYAGMFWHCPSLNYVKCLAEGVMQGTNYTTIWLDGVSATGTFVQAQGASWETGANGIPAGWTISNV